MFKHEKRDLFYNLTFWKVQLIGICIQMEIKESVDIGGLKVNISLIPHAYTQTKL